MKNNSTTWREPAALALSVSLSLVLAGCGGSSDDTPAATPPVTQTPTTPTTPALVRPRRNRPLATWSATSS
jgi:hypothetical protein